MSDSSKNSPTTEIEILQQGPSGVRVRPSVEEDIAAITDIYRDAVLTGTGTFELEPPTEDEMRRRRAAVLANNMPWLVAVIPTASSEPSTVIKKNEETVLGYAYANHFRPRRAYRFCLEDSVYVASNARGHGVGRALLSELILVCERLGARQMLAVIGDSDNAGSIALHTRHDFEHTGVLKKAGRKFDRWLDVVLMQRSLGEGGDAEPVEYVQQK